MSEFFKYWSTLSWYNKGIEVILSLVFIGGVSLLLVILFKLIRKFIKFRITKKGFEILSTINKNDNESIPLNTVIKENKEDTLQQESMQYKSILNNSSSMEEKLFKIIEVREKEINNLKEELAFLENRVQELLEEVQKMQSEMHDSTLLKEYEKKNTVPLKMHQIFNNLQFYLDKTFELVGEEKYPISKKITIRVFICDCMIPTIRDNLSLFLTNMEKMPEEEVLLYIQTIQSEVPKWTNMFFEKAKSVKITFNNGLCIYGIPNSFLNKYGEWYHDREALLIQCVKELLASAFHRTWKMKIISLLDLFNTFLLFSASEAQNRIIQLNGEFEKDLEKKIKAAECKE